VTSLIQPPQVVQLQKRYAEELDKLPMTDEFIAQQLSSFKGTAIHERFRQMLYRYINKYPNSGYMVERRLWDRINGRKISGQFDIFLNGALYDVKSTSVWKRIFGQGTDWEKQLNLYAYMLKTCGIEVTLLYIIAWYMDWDKFKVNQENYPSSPIEQIRIDNMWPEKEQEKFLFDRIELHKSNEDRPDDQLDPCTSDEMWSKEITYAIMKPMAKRAIRTKGMTTRAIAEQYIADSTHKDKASWYVETRPGERTRCKDWCRYNCKCCQYQIYLQEEAEAENEGV